MNWYAHVPLELVNPNNDVNRFAPDVWSKLSKRFFFRMRPLSGPFVREMIFFSFWLSLLLTEIQAHDKFIDRQIPANIGIKVV